MRLNKGKWRVERSQEKRWIVWNPRGELAYGSSEYAYALRYATDPRFRHLVNPDNWFLTT